MSAPGSDSTPLGAVVLVGGRARRMGGAAKHLLELGGSTPWDRTLVALAAHGISPIIAVGPAPADGRLADAAAVPVVTWVREDPPFGGPVAALAAALSRPELDDAAEFLLLAGDLAHPEAVVARLAEKNPVVTDPAETDADTEASLVADCGSKPREAAICDQRAEGQRAHVPHPTDAVVFRAGEHPQWLAGRYRVAAVRAALAAFGEVDGASCRAVLGGLPIRWIADEDGTTADIDTPADLERARADAAGSAARSEEP
ncbi:molybdenum cofactor guanylyltransferase [Microbacterium sp. 2MCAF23]|uniref:molybdenum cofactor guanylyltransferase n=1 Tax=Microbacterium sp. 2MCAF23 TaxID=3232985 RepID=UPI003F9AC198